MKSMHLMLYHEGKGKREDKNIFLIIHICIHTYIYTYTLTYMYVRNRVRKCMTVCPSFHHQ